MRYSVKGKAVPVHAMKVQAGCRLKAPLILNLSTGCSASRIGRFTVGATGSCSGTRSGLDDRPRGPEIGRQKRQQARSLESYASNVRNAISTWLWASKWMQTRTLPACCFCLSRCLLAELVTGWLRGMKFTSMKNGNNPFIRENNERNFNKCCRIWFYILVFLFSSAFCNNDWFTAKYGIFLFTDYDRKEALLNYILFNQRSYFRLISCLFVTEAIFSSQDKTHEANS